MKHIAKRIIVILAVVVLCITTVYPDAAVWASDVKESIINDADIDKENNFVTYSKGWSSSSSSADQYGKDEHWVNNANWVDGSEPYYQITFIGTKLQIFANKSPNLGEYKITIDDKQQGNVSATAPARAVQQMIYETPQLPQGKHVVKVQGIYNSKNMQFDYAKVFYEEMQETGSVHISADNVMQNVVNNINITFEGIGDMSTYTAAELVLTYDDEIFSFDDVQVNDENTIVKANDKGGQVHIVLAFKTGLKEDFALIVRMNGKKATQETVLALTRANLADGSGRQKTLPLAELKTSVTESTADLHRSILEAAVRKAVDIKNKDLLTGLADKVVAYFNGSLDHAVRVLADENATATELLEAWQQLADAMHYLDFKADKTKLEALVKECEALDLTLYEADGKVEFLAALAIAKHTLGSTDVLDETITKSYNQLLTTKNALKPISGELNKIVLNYLIAKANDAVTKEDFYEKDTVWNIFIEALSKAQLMIENGKTQDDFNIAARLLADAYENIRLIANEERLQELQDFIQMIQSLNANMYSKQIYAKIQEASDYAGKLLASKMFTAGDFQMFQEYQAMITYLSEYRIENTMDSINQNQKSAITSTKGTITTAAATAPTGDTTNIKLILFVMAAAVGTGYYIKFRGLKTGR